MINGYLEASQTATIDQKVKISTLLLRPQISLEGLAEHLPGLKNHLNAIKPIREEILEEAEILIKYEGYIEKEGELAQKLERLDSVTLKENFDYHRLTALSFEAREKLSRIKPTVTGTGIQDRRSFTCRYFYPDRAPRQIKVPRGTNTGTDFYPILKILNFKPSGKSGGQDDESVVFYKKSTQKASNRAAFKCMKTSK